MTVSEELSWTPEQSIGKTCFSTTASKAKPNQHYKCVPVRTILVLELDLSSGYWVSNGQCNSPLAAFSNWIVWWITWATVSHTDAYHCPWITPTCLKYSPGRRNLKTHLCIWNQKTLRGVLWGNREVSEHLSFKCSAQIWKL